jgi:hypothetical protein
MGHLRLLRRSEMRSDFNDLLHFLNAGNVGTIVYTHCVLYNYSAFWGAFSCCLDHTLVVSCAATWRDNLYSAWNLYRAGVEDPGINPQASLACPSAWPTHHDTTGVSCWCWPLINHITRMQVDTLLTCQRSLWDYHGKIDHRWATGRGLTSYLWMYTAITLCLVDHSMDVYCHHIMPGWSLLNQAKWMSC